MSGDGAVNYFTVRVTDDDGDDFEWVMFCPEGSTRHMFGQHVKRELPGMFDGKTIGVGLAKPTDSYDFLIHSEVPTS